MRIGINLLYLIPDHVGGTETYALSLMRSLLEVDSRNEYYVFVNKLGADLAFGRHSNLRTVVCGITGKQRLARYVWEQLVLPWQLRYYHIDLVHSFGYVGPLFTSCPRVVTIHDLNYFALRSVIPRTRRYALALFVGNSARRSSHIITPSNYSRVELEGHLGIPSSKITVIPEAPRKFPSGLSSRWDRIAAQYAIRPPYLVSFSGRSPHKNITRLVQAFGQACKDLAHSLVLVGHMPAGFDLLEAVGGDVPLARRIIATGYIPDGHVGPILSSAELFVLPSWYEGFGLPVLEAQQAGIPVTCSSAASIPETAGKGAYFFNPYSVREMAAAIRECLTNPELRQSLQLQGEENLGRFSWEKAARQTLRVYQETRLKSRFGKVAKGS